MSYVTLSKASLETEFQPGAGGVSFTPCWLTEVVQGASAGVGLALLSPLMAMDQPAISTLTIVSPSSAVGEPVALSIQDHNMGYQRK